MPDAKDVAGLSHERLVALVLELITKVEALETENK